jgi:hypothetical protein
MMLKARTMRPARLVATAHPVRAVRCVVVHAGNAMPDREAALQATIDALLAQQRMMMEQQAALIAQQGVLIAGRAHMQGRRDPWVSSLRPCEHAHALAHTHTGALNTSTCRQDAIQCICACTTHACNTHHSHA